MNERTKTKAELLKENTLLKRKIRELENSDSKRKKAEEALRESEELLNVTSKIAKVGGWELDAKTLEIRWTEETFRIHELPLGHKPPLEEAIKYFHPDERGKLSDSIERALKHGEAYDMELRFITAKGKHLWTRTICIPQIENGKTVKLKGTFQDITERKRMEEEIIALSIIDPLTGLHNRRGFLSLAEQQLKHSDRNKMETLLLFADLDGLKWINDTLGHEEGDKALVEAATVFRETFRTSDIIARLGGDEYAVLAVNINEANSQSVTSRLQYLVDKRNHQENRKYRLSISTGCSYYDPDNPCSIDELIAYADRSMYEQKQNKRSLMI
ncbi:MAG: sensor domain-containing diguanylate cyclase [Desulfobacterales bacterium]